MSCRLPILAGVAALVALSCGDSGDGGGGGDPVRSLEEVESATVQIVATGSFIDPEVGLQTDVAGKGSGFIIDPAGIAVTNNHVVAGAATLEVFVPGQEGPRNGVVLGVSECSDLAVIDIEGEGFPYVEWFDDAITTNLEVRAAGYPLGDPEFTLTRGIISKARAQGDTNWASVDGVVEHDARINPGSSGGPLVDGDGQVVGVNYAGSSETDQNLAIGAPSAREVVEQLRRGEDVHSLGINGVAVIDEEAELSGVWVSAVKSGSPADKTGIRAGDIVTRMENLTLSTDGTMKEYCDVIQSRRPGDVIAVEVLRFETEEVLEGQINGRELEQSFSFAEEFGEEVTGSGATSAYTEYETVLDESETIEVEVPVEWSDRRGEPTELGPTIFASTDVDELLSGWEVPGVLFSATREFDASDPEPVLDQLAPDDCTSQGREDYTDPLYHGRYEFFSDCGGTDTQYVVVVAAPEDNAFAVAVAVQLVSDADLDALDRILDSFLVRDF